MCSKKDAEVIVRKLHESSQKAEQLVQRIRRSREEQSPRPMSSPQQSQQQ